MSDDFVYLASEKRTVAEWCDVLNAIEGYEAHLQDDVIWLRRSEEELCWWYHMDIAQSQTLEEEDFKTIKHLKVEQLFFIRNRFSAQQFAKFMKPVLKKFGGYLGNDWDGFKPYVQYENSDEFEYHEGRAQTSD